jgi:hypothetical protein
MPGYLLHVGATVMCAHGGQANATVPNARVRVGGQPTVTQSGPHAVAGCGFVPPSGNGPCLTAQWITAALRVRSGGQALLLQDSQSICTPTGTPLTIVMTQVRARAQ